MSRCCVALQKHTPGHGYDIMNCLSGNTSLTLVIQIRELYYLIKNKSPIWTILSTYLESKSRVLLCRYSFVVFTYSLDICKHHKLWHTNGYWLDISETAKMCKNPWTKCPFETFLRQDSLICTAFVSLVRNSWATHHIHRHFSWLYCLKLILKETFTYYFRYYVSDRESSFRFE